MKKILLLGLFLLTLACKKDTPIGNDEPGITDSSEVVVNTFVKTNPAFPTGAQPVTIYFDLSKGNKALKGISKSVYAFTGLLTTESSNASDWKYGKWNWDELPLPDSKLEKIQGDIYKITLTPTSFYNNPNAATIRYMAFVLRDVKGDQVARNADGSDMVVPVYEAGKLYAKFDIDVAEPKMEQASIFTCSLGTKLNIKGLASQSAKLTLNVNGTAIYAKQGTEISTTYELNQPGIYNVELLAEASGQTATATVSYMVEGGVKTEALPTGVKNGVTRINSKIYFTLTAPDKQFVYLLGSFNNFAPETAYLMNKTPDGKQWWIALDNLNTNQDHAYQYLVDGNLRIADPYAELVLDPYHDQYIAADNFAPMPAYPVGKTTGIVSYTQFTAPLYSWSSTAFVRSSKENLVIYEVLMRDFVAKNNYKTLTDSIPYFKRMGVNCIELMPVNEFEGNLSWGYNPSFYFAADKYYGSKNDLKRFIDLCHRNKIAVVVDMVLNHSFGQSPMVQLYWDAAQGRPAESNPWFNPVPKHAYNVGYDMNHESAYTKAFVKDVLAFWLNEYKIDGFRFDLSKGFTQRMTDPDVIAWGRKDDGRIAIWKDYNQYIRTVSGNAYVILEHFADDNEEVELASDGMLLWNNMNWAFKDAVIGKSGNLERLLFTAHGGADKPSWVSFMESHDEERVMFEALNKGLSDGAYTVKELETALKRVEMAAAFLYLTPGPSMLWQFGEFGYDVSIDEGGRLSEKPLKWDYLNNVARKSLQLNYAKLVRLKTASNVTNTSQVSADLVSTMKYLKLESGTQTVVVVGNWGLRSASAIIPFSSTGSWFNYMTGDTFSVTGNSQQISLEPGQYFVLSKQPIVLD